MSDHYELWSVDSGNLIGDFADKAEAAREVRWLGRQPGAGTYAVLREDEAGKSFLEMYLNTRSGFARLREPA